MKQNTELSLDIIREGTDNFFSENTLCIINVISGTVIINKNDRYETGGLKVINPFQAYRCDTEKGAALLLSIPLSLLRETDMKHCGLIVCNAPDHTVKGKNNEYDHIRKLLANLWVINFDENSEQRKKNLRAKIKDLFRLLQNFFASQEGSLFQLGKDPSNQKVYAVINYIREHWTEDIRISEIADHVKLSPNYLSRFWHKKMGVPLSAYINGIRLEHAKKSLRGSGGITDIALSCGFADANALNRNFKKRFGILPKQYRSQLSATAVSEDKTLDLRYFLSYADTLNEGKKPQTENKSIQINWNTKGTLLTHT